MCVRNLQYPDGYLEAQEVAAGNKKRSHKDNDDSLSNTPQKVKRNSVNKLSAAIMDGMSKDIDNEKLWNECRSLLKDGKQSFLNKVGELFKCICCQEIVYKPITTECRHNFCKVSNSPGKVGATAKFVFIVLGLLEAFIQSRHILLPLLPIRAGEVSRHDRQ